MTTTRLLTFPLSFPFLLLWNVLAFLGRTVWLVITVSFKLTIMLLAIVGLLVWVWW